MTSHDTGDFAAEVVCFVGTGCRFCRRAEALLHQIGCGFKVINVTQRPDLVPRMVEMAGGRRTIPEVFINGTCIGGWDELNTLHEKGELRERLEEPQRGGSRFADLPTQDLSHKEKESGASGQGSRGEGGGEAAATRGKPRRSRLFRRGGRAHHKLYSWAMWRSEPPLNVPPSGQGQGGDAVSANELAAQLHHRMVALYDRFLDDSGTRFDYEGASHAKEFADYAGLTHKLTACNLDGLDDGERTALFINLYNALVIHANIVFGPPASNYQRMRFFSGVTYLVAGHPLSLNDMENGILRANARAPVAFRRQFRHGDPRLRWAVQRVDPRIHFALVCGARSCPPIRVVDAKTLDRNLDDAARAFLSDPEAFEAHPAEPDGTVRVRTAWQGYGGKGQPPHPFLANAPLPRTLRWPCPRYSHGTRPTLVASRRLWCAGARPSLRESAALPPNGPSPRQEYSFCTVTTTGVQTRSRLSAQLWPSACLRGGSAHIPRTTLSAPTHVGHQS